MSLFNLYNEIEKEYENLIPLKQEGLVLFHLYQKQKDGDIGKEFSEEEIIKSLREIRYDLKTNQKIQFNNIVKYFQKYFYGAMKRIGYTVSNLLPKSGAN